MLSLLANTWSLDRLKANFTALLLHFESNLNITLCSIRMLREPLSVLKRMPSRVMPISQVVPSSVVRMSRKSDGRILTVALYGIRGGVKISTSS
jgi:hypothetical protein